MSITVLAIYIKYARTVRCLDVWVGLSIGVSGEGLVGIIVNEITF